jgi:exopolysaccharide production protein ExoY
MRQAQRIILAPAEREMHALESTIDDVPLLRFRPGLMSRSSQAVKRIFDIAVALLLLGSLAPICLIVSLMIIRGGGPIFFAHERVGRGGRIFKCFKFRIMVPDAAAVLEQALAPDPEAREEWLRTRKLRNDPRITWIGKLLRVTSIDELPQLIDVVLGDMSLVGPRPVVQQELHEHYKGDNSYCPLVRPGLTGL